MKIDNKISLKHMKTKHPSQFCTADRQLSFGGGTGGCCGHSRKAKRTAYVSVIHTGAWRGHCTETFTYRDTSEELSQSERSAEVLEQINKMYNNKNRRKAMVLTQVFLNLLLN